MDAPAVLGQPGNGRIALGRLVPLAVAMGREVETQASRWFLWAPVAFGGGAATYFTLKTEPPTWVAALPLLALAAAVGAGRWDRRAPLIASLLLAFFVSGVSAGQLRTWSVAAPVLPERTGPVWVEGWIVDVASPGAGGARLVIAPEVPTRCARRAANVSRKPSASV